MTERFFRCIDCDLVICFTPYDTVPEYEFNSEEEDFVEIYSNDRAHLISNHAKHSIEELIINRDSMVCNAPYMNPMKESYTEATNGREGFVVRKSRESINFPCSYQLIHGRIELKNEKTEIQEKEIRKQMEFEFKKMPEEKIDAFVSAYGKMVSGFNLTRIKDYAEIYETDDSLAGLGKLNKETMDELAKIAEKIFSKNELKSVKEFISENNGFDGVITLRVQRKFEIKKTEKKTGEIVKFPPKEKLIDIRKVGRL